MQYILTPMAQEIPSYVWTDNVFSEQELDWLQNQAKNAQQSAQVGSSERHGVDTSIRKSQISWMKNSPETHWVFEKLGKVAAQVNSKHFNFDLTGFGEDLQLTNYDGTEGGMYNWHQDYNAEVSRKLSLVVQLTDPSEYEGGNLQVATSDEPLTVRKQRGLVVSFPSYVLHQVTPVTQGRRQSLVAWVSGPAFR